MLPTVRYNARVVKVLIEERSRMETKTVNVQDAAAHLAELVEQALQGDEIILVENGTPLVRLLPVAESKPSRVPGLNRGEVWMSDDFNAPLSDSFWLGAS